MRTYNLTPGRELLFACRYRLGTASNFVVHMSEADNVYDPLYGSFVGDQGAWSTAKMYFTVPPNGAAKLHFGAPFSGHIDQEQSYKLSSSPTKSSDYLIETSPGEFFCFCFSAEKKTFFILVGKVPRVTPCWATRARGSSWSGTAGRTSAS